MNALNDQLPLRAAFNPLIRPYLVITIGFTLFVTVVGIPLAIIWMLGVGQWWARHYFEKLDCVLSENTLRYRKGIFFQVEKTIPLENIQDVTFIEGPLLKRFNLSILKFETAGQSAGQAHDMKLVGIIDAHHYRSQILATRERLKRPQASVSAAATDAADTAQTAALHAIQHSLEEISALLKERLPK
jgi:membrane protein YdbS with pleckstrin-like domain